MTSHRETILICFFFPALVFAGEDMLQKEINFLIRTIQTAECVFVRNDTEHNSEEAVAHIKRKYEYFKNRIDTTEKFIELCASRSTFTEKRYQIKCEDGSLVDSRQWLLFKLRRFRDHGDKTQNPSTH